MSSSELTFDDVVEARLPAVSVTMPDPRDAADFGVYREWRYEQGQVWLIHRDAVHAYSKRLAVPEEVPWSGWRHPDGCDCAYCSGSRKGFASVVGREDDDRSVG
jgi:hypothetical protein